MTAASYAEYLEQHGHHHDERDRVTDYQLVHIAGTAVQIGVCANCGEIIARRYVITGSGTGPWTVLRAAQEVGGLTLGS